MNRDSTIESIIHNILGSFKNHINIDKKQESILIYALRLVINSIIAFTLALGLALILGTFKYVLIITLSFAILRTFSGGAHNSSIRNCALNGAIISNILGFVVRYLLLNKETMLTLLLITFLFSLWSIGKYAPADTPSKPITTNAKKQSLRRYSFIVLCLWSLTSIIWFLKSSNVNVYIYASTIGIFWQSITLTRTGYKLYSVLDSALDKVFDVFQKKGG